MAQGARSLWGFWQPFQIVVLLALQWMMILTCHHPGQSALDGDTRDVNLLHSWRGCWKILITQLTCSDEVPSFRTQRDSLLHIHCSKGL